MPLVSIIVPVFNNRTEDIHNCIESLHNDKYSDKVEIIVVDDGSHEKCAKILDALPFKFSKVKVFHQPNKGVSNARNKGVMFALGKYVAFVDADDIVTKDFIPDAILAIESSKSDLDVIYGLVKLVKRNANINLSDSVCIQDNNVKYSILSEREMEVLKCHFFDLSGATFYHNGYYLSRGPIARLVKKNLVEQHKFDETLRIGEDAVWNLDLLRSAKHVAVVKRLWYYYIRNSESATQSLNDKSIGQYEDLIWKLLGYASNDTMKACLLNKTISSSIEIARGYFLTSKFNGSVMRAVSKFNYLFSVPPWNVVLKFKYAFKAGWKCVIKFILIKTGVFLLAIKFCSFFKK